MQNHQETRIYDIIIVGAGPAGCSCALALKNANLKVALFDKKSFPRDKVCGDAIPGRAIKTLKSISADYIDAFRNCKTNYRNRKTRMYYGNRFLDFNWVGESYTCARMDFDHFLLTLVKENTATEVCENVSLSAVGIDKDGVSIKDKNGITYKAKMVIGSDGAHSVIAKQLTARGLDRRHHIGSVRAYYSNVAGTVSDTTEVYLDKRIFPSYLWVFPLPGNRANVGFGMLSSEIARRKLNIKSAFHDFISQTPELAERFKNATALGELEGFGLPLGSKRVQVSGDRFMLVGDAASLIDPVSGDGIGNAMLSGKLAAEQAIKSFAKQDFSAECLGDYDKTLFKSIGSELKLHYRIQRIVPRVPFLLDLVFWMSKNKWLKKLLLQKV